LAAAQADWRHLWDKRRSDAETLRDLAGAARRRGDENQAALRYGEAASWRPDLHFLTIEQARMLEGAGRGAEAEAVLRNALLRLPDEPRLHEELGRLLARLGRAQEAAASLRQSLRLRRSSRHCGATLSGWQWLPMGRTVPLESRIWLEPLPPTVRR